ncbi:hypothetical protein [Streptomyces sp. NPDC059009]|uniref:hypothetical protein n=1 Tax=Streptomyces sp. NPDC059009 TaxID=3346694 RepID=UPI0036CE89E7
MPPRSARKPERRTPPPGRPHTSDRLATGTPATGRWLLRGKDGRLTAYARTPGGLLRWTETRMGGPDWSGPDFFAAPDITYLTLAQGADGYVHFLGRRERVDGDGAKTVDLVHNVQYQTGRPLMEWRSLGNPHTKRLDRAPSLGVPCGAVDGAGSVHVFVRDAVGSVRMRREGKGGKWEGWTDLKGSQCLDGLTAVATSTGRVELVAPARNGMLRWTQEEPGGAFRRADDMAMTPAAGCVTALETAPDRITYFAGDIIGTGVLAHRPGDDGPTELGSTPDDNPGSALRTKIEGHDCTVLAHRTLTGRPVIAAYPTQDEEAGVWWTATGEPCLGSPALALDGRGRVVMAAVGTDGTLRVARQKAEPGLALAAWARV